MALRTGVGVKQADLHTLVRSATRPLWRFGAYVVAASRAPVGPVGYVEVDAVNGAVLADAHTAEEIAARGEWCIVEHQTRNIRRTQ